VVFQNSKTKLSLLSTRLLIGEIVDEEHVHGFLIVKKRKSHDLLSEHNVQSKSIAMLSACVSQKNVFIIPKLKSTHHIQTVIFA